jgi:hypothetical protein
MTKLNDLGLRIKVFVGLKNVLLDVEIYIALVGGLP